MVDIGILLSFIAIAFWVEYAAAAIPITCQTRERETLLNFKAGFSDSTGVLKSWKNKTNCCVWAGITCNRDGLVEALELGFAGASVVSDEEEIHHLSKNLSTEDVVEKYLPHLKALQVLNLSTVGLFRFPSSLGDLPNLTTLSLSHCGMSHSIPPQIGNLTKLQILDLTLNTLSGTIPVELCQLHNLRYVLLTGKSPYPDLDQNYFTGPIPSCLGAQQRFLTYLDLSHNGLEGPIPALLGQLVSLQYLDLSSNNLNGSFPPQLCNLTQLTSLDFSFNTLEQNLPPCLSQLHLLQSLQLQWNQLTGSIPPQIGNLHNLQYLSLERNLFTGVIPEQLGSLINLKQLSLGSDFISGSVPSSFGNLLNLEDLTIDYSANLQGTILMEMGKLSKLQKLVIQNTGLTGSIPPSFGTLSALTQLTVIGNNLTGPIPSSLGAVTNLVSLDLTGNKLTGVIPGSLGKLLKLTTLGLGQNMLTGSVPSELGNLVQLPYMALNDNLLSGQIPPQFFSRLVKLKYVFMFDNLLTGQIPPSLANIDGDASIDLSHNQLTGRFPLFLCNFQSISLSHNHLTDLQATARPTVTNKLQKLDVSSNRLAGPLPSWLGQQVSLEILDLSNNSLTGKWTSSGAQPNLSQINLSNNKLSELPYLPTASYIDLHGNQLQGPVTFQFSPLSGTPVWLLSLDVSQNLLSGSLPEDLPLPSGKDIYAQLSTLSLAANKLSGMIPSFLGTRVQMLETLNLSHCAFEGEIPAAIANITALQYLDISHNQLHGLIPQQLGHLSNLKQVDVSYNHLQGPIPSEWKNFTASSFAENAGLCGAPLPLCHF